MKRAFGFLWLALASSAYADSVVAPVISTINPSGGLAKGGQIVHLHGKALAACPICHAPEVKFGGVNAEIVDSLMDELVVVAPPHPAGVVDIEIDVEVNYQALRPVILTSGFIYQEPPAYEHTRFLVPVATNVQGAFASDWHADLSIHNSSSQEPVFTLAGYPTGTTISPVRPLATINPSLYTNPGNAGAFLYVPKGQAEHTEMRLRVHDASRDADSWGTEIPIIGESQFRQTIDLLEIPRDERFRSLLRIYSYSGDDTPVVLELHDGDTGEVIAVRSLILGNGSGGGPQFFPFVPAYLQVPLESIFEAGAATSHAWIRISIDPRAASHVPIWAFITVTNDVTQQATTITPSLRAQ